MDKSKLIFLDTETTGKGPTDRLCQLAYKFKDEEFEGLFKPPVKIKVEAMSVSHITNKMVEDKEPFIGSEMREKLAEIFANGNILVAHNAQFDVEMLKRENLEIKNIIDTYKIAHALDKDAKIPKYNLQYLRYFLDLEIENVVAHSALGDVKVLEKLFERLFQKMMTEFEDENVVIEQMLKISAQPLLMKKFPFGKYKGAMVVEVAKTDLGYLRWLLNEKNKTKDQEGDGEENWIYTLEYYLKQK
ncbi:MAG: exonuclease domain-containing protein [Candidatus Moranbacteria bacterium]|nr:exonuclease domain-containing protein [Candidatus Moranbacteria bacterium]